MIPDVHQLFCGLPRYRGREKSLPKSGIYLFFEQGETLTLDGALYERIVRIGTHKADGRFPGRIGDHYRGNRAGSVFRRHLGNAILRSGNADDARLPVWAIQKGQKLPDVEALVTEALESRFSFVCFPVASKVERLELESGLIALLARGLREHVTPSWLGHHALDHVTRRPRFPDGLWNVNEVRAQALTAEQFARIEAYSRGR